ncbi:MAG TPA: choice-of-anchor D domain-containing protein [Candidatus Solibacter sp.]|nr:choice-of-anchor D domain-containing protein [Candidatus Solibacter sp.]
MGLVTAATLVTITNQGPDPLTITAIALGGTNPGDFKQSGPVLPITLTSGGSVAVGVRFSPTAAGPRSAVLVFTDNGFHGPQSVPLSGTGQAVATVSTFGAFSVELDIHTGAPRSFDHRRVRGTDGYHHRAGEPHHRKRYGERHGEAEDRKVIG